MNKKLVTLSIILIFSIKSICQTLSGFTYESIVNFDGSGTEWFNHISSNNVTERIFTSGMTDSNDGDFSSNPDSGSSDNTDGFIVCSDELGNKIWTNTYGGTGASTIFETAVNTASNELFACGFVSSTDEPAFPSLGNWDMALWKVDPDDGSIIWKRRYGGSARDVFRSITISGNGEIILSGTTGSSDGDFSNSHVEDVFVMSVSPIDGSINWVYEPSNNTSTGITNVLVSNTNDIYVTFESNNTNGIFTSETFYGFRDTSVFKLSSTGILQWAKHFGGNLQETPRDIKQLSNGNILITSYSNSTVSGLISVEPENTWLTEIDQNGNLVNEKSLANTGTDMYSIFFSNTGELYLSGFVSGGFSDWGSAGSFLDVLIVKLDSNYDLEDFLRVGGGTNEMSPSMIQTSDGGFAISFASENNSGIYSNSGGQDIYTMKYSPSLMFTKMYSNAGENYIEIKNISDVIVPLDKLNVNVFDINGIDPTGYSPDNVIQLPEMQPGEALTIKNNSSELTVYGNYIDVAFLNFDNLETFIISRSSGNDAFEKRIDVFNDGISFSGDFAFVKGCGDHRNQRDFDLSKWVEFEINFIQAATGLSNSSFGVYEFGPTQYSGGVWSNGQPDRSREVIISETYDIDTTDLEACTLTIESGNHVYVSNGKYVYVEKELDISARFFLENGSSLVSNNDSFIINYNSGSRVSFTKESSLLGNYQEYTYWSSPMQTQSAGSIFNNAPTGRVYEFITSNYNDSNDDDADDEGDDWSSISLSSILTVGKGYAAMGDTNVTYPASNSKRFSGTFNNGNISIPITINGAGGDDDDWNLIGNPYPSPIDLSSLLFYSDNNTKIAGTFYLWDHVNPAQSIFPGPYGYNYSANDYAIYSVGSGGISACLSCEIPNGFASAAQGFFVEGLQNGSLNFSNSMRVIPDASNDIFYRNSVGSSDSRMPPPPPGGSLDQPNRFRLNLTNEFGGFSQMLIGFFDLATDQFDVNFDSRRILTGNFVNLHSGGLAILGNGSFQNDYIIPLSYQVDDIDNIEYKISLATVEGIFSDGQNIYLKDNDLNIVHNLSEENNYSFFLSNNESSTRFEIIFDQELTVYEFEEEFNNSIVLIDEQLIIKSKNDRIKNVQLYSLLGQKIFDKKINKLSTSINIENLDPGVYIVKAYTNEGKQFSKKVIND